MPEPLDHVLIQADLTAIAPGPLQTAFAAELGLAADVESTGGATVYRFSESSIRRALDAGRSAADLHALLADRSRTPVPQPLTYLIDDMARRHGRIRVSAAAAVIRADDENLLQQILADRRAGQLRLRRLAPTVLAARTKVEHVLDQLRVMGYAPVAESPDGEMVVKRPNVRRAPQPNRSPRLGIDPAVPAAGVLDVVVRALRAGDRAAVAAREPVLAPGDGSLTRSPAWQTMATLTAALRTPGPLWIGYVDNSGTVSERLVDPVRLDGGFLTAYDHRREEIRTFAVHRITGVAANLRNLATDRHPFDLVLRHHGNRVDELPRLQLVRRPHDQKALVAWLQDGSADVADDLPVLVLDRYALHDEISGSRVAQGELALLSDTGRRHRQVTGGSGVGSGVGSSVGRGRSGEAPASMMGAERSAACHRCSAACAGQDERPAAISRMIAAARTRPRAPVRSV